MLLNARVVTDCASQNRSLNEISAFRLLTATSDASAKNLAANSLKTMYRKKKSQTTVKAGNRRHLKVLNANASDNVSTNSNVILISMITNANSWLFTHAARTQVFGMLL